MESNISKKKVILYLIFCIVAFYLFCYSYHNIAMMVNGANYPDDLVGCEFGDEKDELFITFENEEIVMLRQLDDGKTIRLFMYKYSYEEGSYLMEFKEAYIIPEKELEDNDYKKDLSMVRVEEFTLFINNYRKYLYLMRG